MLNHLLARIRSVEETKCPILYYCGDLFLAISNFIQRYVAIDFGFQEMEMIEKFTGQTEIDRKKIGKNISEANVKLIQSIKALELYAHAEKFFILANIGILIMNIEDFVIQYIFKRDNIENISLCLINSHLFEYNKNKWKAYVYMRVVGKEVLKKGDLLIRWLDDLNNYPIPKMLETYFQGENVSLLAHGSSLLIHTTSMNGFILVPITKFDANI